MSLGVGVAINTFGDSTTSEIVLDIPFQQCQLILKYLCH